jgi:hypothetical protein
MTKRPGLAKNLPVREETDRAVATAKAISQAQQAPPEPAGDDIMTTSSIHMPLSLLESLRSAANRRATRKARERGPKVAGERRDSTRPSVSEIVVEILTRHRAELDKLD